MKEGMLKYFSHSLSFACSKDLKEGFILIASGVKMNAFKLIEGYKVEKVYSDNGNRVYSLIKLEHLDKKVHDQIIAEKHEELIEILKDKEKTKTNLWQATLHWLENYFSGWLSSHYPHLTGLEYSFIVNEAGDSYFIIKNDLEVELANKEQIGLIKKALCSKKEKHGDWIEANAEKFRKILKESTIHEGEYIVLENLEKRIEEELES